MFGALSGSRTVRRIGYVTQHVADGIRLFSSTSPWMLQCELAFSRNVHCTMLRHPCMQGASKQNDSVADVVLTGHTDIAEFAEGISNAAPLVASGGRDTNVRSCLCNHCNVVKRPS